MSAQFLDPAHTPAAPINAGVAATLDLETTSDLQGDATLDLPAATHDIGSPGTLELPAHSHPHTVEIETAPARTAAHTTARSTATSDLPAARLPQIAPAPAEPALTPGTVLGDRFILEKLIGKGGTAVVYQARDMAVRPESGAAVRVALKAARLDIADRQRATARLRHEFEHARGLSHPSIVRVFELHEEGPTPFMTMELIEGRLLSTIVRDWTLLPRALAYKILRACAQALAHAHGQDVVHGDFKPGNVFVTREEQVKIVDFGAAAPATRDSVSRIPAGTPAYASPQVLSGEQPEPRDDVFSFACVAYELLTGRHPFAHRSSLEAREQSALPARAWNLSTPQWLALLSALSWARAQRPPSIETLSSTLMSESEPISETAPVHPSATAATDLPSELMPPQRGWGFFLFVACAVSVTFIATQRQATPPQRHETPVAAAHGAAPAASLPAIATSVVGAMERSAVARERLASSDRIGAAAQQSATDATTPAATAAAVAKPAGAAAALSEISFESRSIVTTEGSVAAVFLIKRSQPLRGRTRVQWKALSGTADAGIDFASNAAGSVEFADGQAQRAIYVPLRNDLLQEGEETFTVRLVAPQNARLGAIAQAEAAIRDDD